MRKVEVTKEFSFEAAHYLPAHKGACAGMHGHGYRLEVTVEGPVGANDGMVIDFDDLSLIVQIHVLDRLDHTLLNDRIENPTAENIALTTWEWLAEPLPTLARVVVHETAHNRATVTAK